jgi:tetratricopeptide (TPR) repeat protein
VLLGDLHLKQARHQEAVAAYQKAVDIYQKAFDSRRKAGLDLTGQLPADVKNYLTALELYTKLAQGHQATGDGGKALKDLKKISEYSQEMEQLYQSVQKHQQARAAAALNFLAAAGRSPGDGAEAPAIPLPCKLIVSVSKKALASAGTGKLSFDEFKKGATVQFLNFPAPRSSPAPAGAGRPPQPAARGESGNRQSH